MPIVPSTPFREHVVNLQAIPHEEGRPCLCCAECMFCAYTWITYRASDGLEQLCVCFISQQKKKATSKQIMANWIVNVIWFNKSKVHHVPLSSKLTPLEVLQPLWLWQMVHHWQASAELRGGLYPTPSQDFRISM